MPKTPSPLEQELKNLKPRGIEDDFLERLVSCAEGTDVLLSSGDLKFEGELRSNAPRKLTASEESVLLEKIGDAPFHVDEKIVLFNKPNRNSKNAKKSNVMRYNFAAAAAVALLGSIVAIMLPSGVDKGAELANKSQTNEQIIEKVTKISPEAASRFSAVSYNRNLSETYDEGVILKNQTEPYRVMRMTYTDHVVLTNDDGETIEVTQPKVEYVVMPEKID